MSRPRPQSLQVSLVSLALAGVSTTAWAQEPTALRSAPQAEEPAPLAEDGTYLVSLRSPEAAPAQPRILFTSVADSAPRAAFEPEDDDDLFGDTGFLYGMGPAVRAKPRPIDQPFYFDDPYINTELGVLYLYNRVPNVPPPNGFGGGDFSVVSLQGQVALTERIAFTVTELGISSIGMGAFPEDQGGMDTTLGVKAALLWDSDEDFILSVGGRVLIPTGSRAVLKSLTEEWSVYVTAAKGWQHEDGHETNLIANLNLRHPFNKHDGNVIISGDLHANHEIIDGVFPLVEIHGLYYATNGTRTFGVAGAPPLRTGGLDYANLGVNGVRGLWALWSTLGVRWQIADHVSIGAGYSTSLRWSHDDLIDSRFLATLSFIL